MIIFAYYLLIIFRNLQEKTFISLKELANVIGPVKFHALLFNFFFFLNNYDICQRSTFII